MQRVIKYAYMSMAQIKVQKKKMFGAFGSGCFVMAYQYSIRPTAAKTDVLY